MPSILLYGDSNTWGYDPHTGTRFDRHTRWGGVLRDLLGPEYEVIEDGLNGRTTVHDDPVEDGAVRNGLGHLLPALLAHAPLDQVIILLGTNDLKPRFNVDAGDIALGVGRLLRAVRLSEAGPVGSAPRALLICPPPTAPLEGTPFAEMFAGAYDKSRRLASHYAAVAAQHRVDFLDAGQVITSSPVDGIHWEADAHAALARAVYERVRRAR
ncbi:MAG: SGNH/GDSL hydrolase family protein [Anaerolinea sp.]|nr:SGNH/GDSL hydrolase family protein [Anaerolinea sp.]